MRRFTRILGMVASALAVASSAPSAVHSDSTGDIAPGLATGNGTLDIVGMG